MGGSGSQVVNIQLTRGKFALVDAADADLVRPYKWQAMRSPNGRWTAVHSRRKPRPGLLLMHRLIMDSPNAYVDHINGDPLDNRRANLRIATNQQNQWNSSKAWGRSRFRGVAFDARPQLHKHWVSYIRTSEGRKYLGNHYTEEAAWTAYRLAAYLYHGEYFPSESDDGRQR